MRDLPQGTVTFLFTDIEGSTRLLKQLGEGYGEVLAEHQRLLRDAFEGAGGQEIDRQGDSFFFAFARAKNAVTAAIAGQRALDAHRWPKDAALRVRWTRPACRTAFRLCGWRHHFRARAGGVVRHAFPGTEP